MRKFLIIVCTLAILLCLAACNAQSGPDRSCDLSIKEISIPAPDLTQQFQEEWADVTYLNSAHFVKEL